MIRLLLALVAVLVFSTPALAQAPWSDVPATRAEPRTDLRAYRLVQLDAGALRARLAGDGGARAAAELPIPLPDGGTAAVRVAESSVMAPALQARYPEIRTYAVEGELSGRFAMTPAGFTALFYADGVPFAIDAVEGDLYAVYHAADLVLSDAVRGSLRDDLVVPPGWTPGVAEGRRRGATGEQVRTYRLAVAARGEFTQAQLNPTVAGGLAAVTASVNRVNAIYLRDMAVRFELVADNDEIIFTDPNTDPFTGRGSDLLDQNQTALDARIGSENYDVGHVLGFDEGGGVAYLSAACQATIKGGGVSGVGRETSAFDLLVFPHELGHMLGAPHAFVEYSPGTGTNANGYEPGPGYTLMSYPQFASYRPASERVGFHFHAGSLDFMEQHVRFGGGSCGTDTASGNDVPVVTVPAASVVIPADTPFLLEGSGADASPLAFVWEQMDRYRTGAFTVPLFRSVDPGPSPARYFPDLGRALAGTPYPDETLPSQPGAYRFRLTARDGEGGIGYAQMVVEVIASDAPFAITAPAGPVVYGPGSPMTVTWDVAGTDAAPIGAATVDIFLSADGGETFTLAASATPNDGEATVTAPDAVSGRGGFVMVRPTGNVFYALNAEPFEVGLAPAATLSDRALEVRVAPAGTGEATLTVANDGADGSALSFDLAIESLVLPSGDRVSPSSGYGVALSGEADGPAVRFDDISASGTPLSFSSSDDGAASVALPFAFPFYGQSFSSVAVLTNGFLQFVGSTPGAYENQAIPSTTPPDGVVAPFWDDLRLESGAVYTGTLADGRFVVQWTRVGRYVQSGPNSGTQYSFQVILSPDGTVEFQYGTLNGPLTSATVGIESPDGTDGLQLAFNEEYVRPNTAVRFDPARSWLTLEGAAGTLARGASAAVRFVVDATGFAEGDRADAVVVLRTNDGALSRLVIPVDLVVSSNPVAAEDGPAAAVVSLVAPNPTAGRAELTVALAAPGAVRATLHDVLGREVAVLHDGPAVGTLALSVDAGSLAAGAYVVRVVGDAFVASRRLVVVR